MNWQTQMNSADSAVAQGNLPVAEYLYWEALKLAEAFGANSPQLVDTAERLGNVLLRQSKFDEAEDLLLRLAEIVGSNRAMPATRSANTLLKLAEVYYSQGKYDRAEPFAMRALQSYEQSLGVHHPETVRVSGNVAYVFHALQKYPQAEELYQRAIALKTKSNKYDSEAMNLMSSYASLLRELHRDGEAEHILRCIQGLQSGNWEVLPPQPEPLT